ncbi:IclR family transcriptional regulator domain-containing protein [Neoaquamicrobium microcysteis]|uniref:IclR family transcriptional regulator domain-containing protein n=1 Tax=Neoaquamicrobium microcysteis TaxID=2682781 RepID=UPI001375D33F|nr:IclR family transcriptional regulator C-terminal domain-containing protein [Mesorhizobium microcysteis]
MPEAIVDRLETVEVEIVPELRAVSDRFGDACSISILSNNLKDILYIARSWRPTGVRISATAGSRLPAYLSGMGRVMLANLHPEEMEQYWKVFKPVKATRRTVTDRCELEEIFEDIKK